MSTSLPPPCDPVREGDHPLARAFRSFTEAAGSLERTYGQLHGQVAHLRQELEVTNRNLTASLEENHRIRERLRRILEGLPCGVLVIEAGARVSAVNPEAARLLGGSFETVDALPDALARALESARHTGEERTRTPRFFGRESGKPGFRSRTCGVDRDMPRLAGM